MGLFHVIIAFFFLLAVVLDETEGLGALVCPKWAVDTIAGEPVF